MTLSSWWWWSVTRRISVAWKTFLVRTGRCKHWVLTCGTDTGDVTICSWCRVVMPDCMQTCGRRIGA